MEYFLDSFNFGLVKIDFSALGAYPGRDSVKSKMIAFPVNMERGNPSFHLPLAIHAIHGLFLFLKSYSQF
jgi:hypothetical protein